MTENNALLAAIKKSKGYKPVSSGQFIGERLRYPSKRNVTWFNGYQNIDIKPQRVLTRADYDFKFAVAPVTIAETEKALNEGANQVYSLYGQRIEEALSNIENTIDEGLYSDGMGFAGLQIDGLQQFVSITPASGVVGGIDASIEDNAWWRNQFATAALTEDNISRELNKLWLTMMRSKDMPNLLVSDAEHFNLYWGTLEERRRFGPAEMTSGGTKGVMFNSAVMVMGSGTGMHAPTKRTYFLNTKYLCYRPHRRYNIKPLPPVRSINQVATVTLVMFGGNMTCSNRNLQGVLVGTQPCLLYTSPSPRDS